MPKVNATTQLLYKEIELVSRKIPVVPQQELKVYFKGQVLRKAYIADYMAYAKLSLRSKRSIH